MKKFPKTYKRARQTFKRVMMLRGLNESPRQKDSEKVKPSYTFYYDYGRKE